MFFSSNDNQSGLLMIRNRLKRSVFTTWAEKVRGYATFQVIDLLKLIFKLAMTLGKLKLMERRKTDLMTRLFSSCGVNLVLFCLVVGVSYVKCSLLLFFVYKRFTWSFSSICIFLCNYHLFGGWATKTAAQHSEWLPTKLRFTVLIVWI